MRAGCRRAPRKGRAKADKGVPALSALNETRTFARGDAAVTLGEPGLDADDETEMLDAQNECTFIWSNKEGWPVGVIMSYVFVDGKFWLTASSQRARIAAVPISTIYGDEVSKIHPVHDTLRFFAMMARFKREASAPKPSS